METAQRTLSAEGEKISGGRVPSDRRPTSVPDPPFLGNLDSSLRRTNCCPGCPVCRLAQKRFGSTMTVHLTTHLVFHLPLSWLANVGVCANPV